jgi:hypothetical protein
MGIEPTSEAWGCAASKIRSRKHLKFRLPIPPPCYTLHMGTKHDRPALGRLLELLIRYGEERVRKRAPLPPCTLRPKLTARAGVEMATPQEVEEAIARAEYVLAKQRLLEMPMPSKRIH